MSTREYRKKLEYDSEDGKIELSEAIDMIDVIEQDVNLIKDMLQDYTNLTEIKIIYKLLEELSNKLY